MTSQEIASVLSDRGLRPTQQRIAVYAYLIDHPIHPTADTIYREIRDSFPTFSRTTIYNSLRSLVKARLIRTVNIDAEEQRFDGNASDHAHFKCVHCGRLYDFEVDSSVLEQLCPAGFQAEIKDIYLSGSCQDCTKKTLS